MTLLALSLSFTACDSGEPGGRSKAAAAKAASAGPTAAQAVTPKPAARRSPATAKGGEIKWPESFTWHSYEKGSLLAKQSGKPLLLLVYADWCSKCRALVPVLERSDVRTLVEQMVVVRHNQDDPPPWGSELGVDGNYVPRIIFLNADGSLQRKVTSGHSRYPFFYSAEQPDVLLGSLKQALRI